MRHRLTLALSAPLLMFSLAACDPGSQAMLAGASLVSLNTTDKTIPDYVATWAFDKDCSTLALADGKSYCRNWPSEAEREAAAAAQPKTYCYRTIGTVNCYRRPDTMASSDVRVP